MLARLAVALAFALLGASPAAARGTISHFVRTGLDGAEPEHIHVYRPGGGRIEVYKMRARCTSAALVTADYDAGAQEVRRIVGGRLARDGTQQPVAHVAVAPVTRTLDVRADLPDRTLRETHAIGPAALWLYDFDGADLTLTAPQETRSLAFGWPGGQTILVTAGRADLTLAGRETRDGRAVRRYRAGGPAFAGDQGGDVWVDAASGRLVEARLGRPNHPGYKGLSLKLQSEAAADAAAWRALLQAHFKDCPP